MKISFITTCKNRLHHLQETLPLMVAQQPFEIIVVDYGCPQGTGDWVREHFPAVKVVDVNDDPGFCAARARNLGAAAAQGDWLVFIDADVKVQGDWVGWMRTHLQWPWFYRASQHQNEFNPEIFGTFICSADIFNFVKKYDETFRGWGGEDTDIYKRLKMHGVPSDYYPHEMIQAISHSDAQRVIYKKNKNKNMHHIYNELYITIKHQIIQMFRAHGDLSDDMKRGIIKKVDGALIQLSSNKNSAPVHLNFECSGKGWLPGSYKLRKKVTISFEIEMGDD